MSRATTRKPKPRPTAAPAPTVGNADPIGNAHDLPEGISRLADVLIVAMQRIAARQAASERMTLRLDEVAAMLGLSRSAVERERRAGRFPPPDKVVGRMPLWIPRTIRQWVEDGGGR